MEELKSIMEKFVASGWDLISIPAQQWLEGKADKDIFNRLKPKIRNWTPFCFLLGVTAVKPLPLFLI